MKRSIVIALWFVSASGVAQWSNADIVVYDNTTTLWLNGTSMEAVAAGDGNPWGDEVNLAGSARIGKQLQVLMFCTTESTADTVLSLYDNTGIDGAPNNLLWTSDLGVVNYASYDVTALSATLPDVLLPDTVTWTVTLYGRQGGGVYTPLYDPPTVGGSGDWIWVNQGAGFSRFGFHSHGEINNLGAKITANVPEPTSLVLLCIGASAVGLISSAWRRA
jgi:hypothetical protein